jgi:hypothetical protein
VDFEHDSATIVLALPNAKDAEDFAEDAEKGM